MKIRMSWIHSHTNLSTTSFWITIATGRLQMVWGSDAIAPKSCKAWRDQAYTFYSFEHIFLFCSPKLGTCSKMKLYRSRPSLCLIRDLSSPDIRSWKQTWNTLKRFCQHRIQSCVQLRIFSVTSTSKEITEVPFFIQTPSSHWES